MKISLALRPKRTLSRQTAWGCFTTNLALPGCGSLMAGYVSGYPQALLGFGGLGLTTLFGLRFIWWCLANWSRLYGDQVDPWTVFPELWMHLRWALLGIGLFLAGMLWALVTSSQILSEAKTSEATSVPPRLGT